MPVVWMLVSLLALPLVVYVISYIPWAMIEGNQLIAGWPPGHTGQTLIDLTGEMYQYHNNLSAPHAASSPWWAWPFNLKPVWFYQGNFAKGTAASIYDAGNLVIWWLGVPAMVFVAYQAFQRRSLALALILVGFLCQWLSWARIDRAAFQYHYYTSLPFIVLALGYFVGRDLDGPRGGRGCWPGSPPCRPDRAGHPVADPQAAVRRRQRRGGQPGLAGVPGQPGQPRGDPGGRRARHRRVVALVVLVRLLLNLGRPHADGRRRSRDLLPLAMTAVGAARCRAPRALPADAALFSFTGVVPELIALAAVPLGLVALQVVTARDAHRFAAGSSAAAAWFVVLYPNISALPMPATIVNAYQGLLPTYLYPFQFPVNTVDRGGAISFADPRSRSCGVLGSRAAWSRYATWVWRMALADDERPRGPGTPVARGATGPA